MSDDHYDIEFPLSIEEQISLVYGFYLVILASGLSNR